MIILFICPSLALYLTGYYMFGLIVGVIITFLFYKKATIYVSNLGRQLTDKPAIELTDISIIDHINKVAIPWENIRGFELIYRQGHAFIVFYLKDRSLYSRRLKDTFEKLSFKILQDIKPVQIEISLVRGKNHDIYNKVTYVFENYRNNERID